MILQHVLNVLIAHQYAKGSKQSNITFRGTMLNETAETSNTRTGTLAKKKIATN